MNTEKHRDLLINAGYFALIVCLIYVVFNYLLSLIMPFFIAVIFAAIIRPLVKLLKNKCHMKENIAGLISLVIFFALLGGLLVLCLTRIITSIADIFSALPTLYSQTLEPAISNLLGNLEEWAHLIDPAIVDFVNDASADIISSIGSAVTNISVSVLSAISSTATKVPSFLMSSVICVIATVFITVDYTGITTFIMRQLPTRGKNMVLDVKNAIVHVLFRYGRSYALIMFITFAEIAVGLLIIGIKNSLLIAVLIAIFDIFPIVGAGMILFPWAVITLIQGNIARGIGLLILYVIVIVVRQIIEPKIIGRHVGLHPIVTLMSMYIGTKLFGGIGLFGLPILLALIVNLDDSGAIRIFKRADTTPPDDADDDGQ